MFDEFGNYSSNSAADLINNILIMLSYSSYFVILSIIVWVRRFKKFNSMCFWFERLPTQVFLIDWNHFELFKDCFCRLDKPSLRGFKLFSFHRNSKVDKKKIKKIPEAAKIESEFGLSCDWATTCARKFEASPGNDQ